MADIVTELRKLEGINTSFDYGVELVVMAVKKSLDYEEMKYHVRNNERSFGNLFRYDEVCSNGFYTAKDLLYNRIKFNESYLEFVKQFDYPSSNVFAMISEYKLILNTYGLEKRMKDNEIKDLIEFIKENGFTFSMDCKPNFDVEFKIMPRA